MTRTARTARALLAGAMTLTIGGLVAPAPAAALDSTPAVTPSFDGTVYAVAKRGSTIFVGGDFTSVEDADGTYVRRGLAAVDAATGKVLRWSPAVEGTVRDLVATKKGVFVGGDFTSVRGKPRTNLALVRRTGGGRLTGLKHRFDQPVRALAVSSSRLYVGGDFTRVDGRPRERLAAFGRTAPFALQRWAPKASATVLALQHTRGGVYVGGKFYAMNRNQRFARLARVTPVSGALMRSFRPSVAHQVLDIVLDGAKVYAGVGGPNGGFAAAYRRDTGRRTWLRRFDGDVQAVARLGRTVYVGGHFGEVCDTDNAGPTGDCLDGGQTRRRLAALAVGRGQLRGWSPDVDSVVGIRELEAWQPGLLALGGDFEHVGGEPRGRFALFR